MKLRTKLFGLAAAVAICLGVAAPAAAVGPSTSTTSNLTVNFSNSGTFSVAFGAPTGFTGGSVDASTGATVTGQVSLIYTDTNAVRGGFHVDMSAGNFNSTIQVPYEASGVYYSIPASNLKLTKNYNPGQLNWTSKGCSAGFPGAGCVNLYRVGDIGATDQAGQSIGNNPFSIWTAANTLETPRKVAQGWAGAGTIGTLQAMDLSLTIPAAMPAGDYVSVLNATVVGETP